MGVSLLFKQPEEMNQQWLREDTLVAKGQVEVLILDGKVTIHRNGGRS